MGRVSRAKWSPFRKHRSPQGGGGGKRASAFSLEALEPRLLLSAAPGTTLIEVDGRLVEVAADQWIVRLAPGDEGKTSALGDSLRALSSSAQITPLTAPGFALVSGADLTRVELDAWAAARPDVTYVSPNFVYRPTLVPNDPNFNSQWGLSNLGQTGGTPGADIGALAAWNITTGSSDVVIAVIDTGVDYTHPDLVANMWRNPGEIPGNGIDDDGNGFIDDVFGWDFANNDNDPMDVDGHGTHVAGTIGAVGDNSLGVTGVAWNVQIMAIKFLDPFGTTADAIDSVNYVTMMRRDFGVNVVASNNSWGGGGFDQGLLDAINAANSAGILFVAAAGNGGFDGIGDNNDLFPHFPSNFDAPNVIAVAATDHNNNRAAFSNFGVNSVDLGAPGAAILSTLPGGTYGTLSGTSMAAPHVTGVVALMASANPDASAAQIKSALLSSTSSIQAMANITTTGGLLRAFDALLGVSGGQIEGVKFHDLNGNGVRDFGEPGLEGWVILIDENNNGLVDPGEPFAVTDADGRYRLLGLQPGTYTVAELQQEGWAQTFPVPPGTHVVVLGEDEVATDINFGNASLASIAGRKFHDFDGDGVRDLNDTGLSGWTIYIDANDNGVRDVGERFAITDNLGNYRFNNLDPDTYLLREELQAGWTSSQPGDGEALSVTVTYGDAVTTANFLNFQFGQISGRVFEDINGNGVQDAGEPGLANVRVFLDEDEDGEFDGGEISVMTDAMGDYLFPLGAMLAPGEYRVTVEVPDPNATGVLAPASGFHTIFLSSTEVDSGNNFALIDFATIGGTLFEDLDADGVRDLGEPGLANWTLFLDANLNGQFDAGELTTTSDALGQYTFTGVAPGSYQVRQVVEPGFVVLAPVSGHHDVTVISGQVVSGLDFANVPVATITGTKWNDLNGDGVRDIDEPGLANFRIYLDANENGQFDAGEVSVLTDAMGDYTITNLLPGTYRVAEVLQAGFEQTSPSGGVHVLDLAAGDTATGIDFGNFQFSQIAGMKFEDVDGDGVRDPDEPALAGWTIFLDANDNGVLDAGETSTVTVADGSYAFGDLAPGNYVVREVIPAGWGQSLPNGADESYEVTLTSGGSFSGLDFGNYRFVEIHGVKWNDLNGNGVRDEGTFAIFDGPITLLPPGPVILAANDDLSTGLINFGFTFDFFGASYDQFYINNNGNITFTQPFFSFIPDGFPQDLPIIAPFWADVDTRGAGSDQVRLRRGTSVRGNPFVQIDWRGVGYFAANADLLNDFTLYIEDDPGGDIVAFFYRDMQWTTGDIDGFGGFGGEGAQIGFDSGDGENFISLARPNTISDLDAFRNTAYAFRIDPTGIPEGEPGIPGVTVYLDLNNNGQLDAGEPSTVTAADDLGTPDVNEAGTYSFTGLRPGQYVVREIVPAGFTQTFPLDPVGNVETGSRLSLVQPDPGVAATFTGNIGVSTDGLGTNATGTLNADIPDGSTIEQAYLHVVTRALDQAFQPNTIRFDGVTVPITWLTNVDHPLNSSLRYATGRVDVTQIVADHVGADSGVFAFTLDETVTGSSFAVEGTSLTVIYSNPALPLGTIAVLDGGLSGPEQRSFRMNFNAPVDTGAAGFGAELALGLHSSPPNGAQFTTVDVNNFRLTSAAGGADDSAQISPSPGNLITVGGVGNTSANPLDPNSQNLALDDELYDLTGFLNDGDTGVTLTFGSPTGNQSLFLVVLTLPGLASLDPQDIGEGASLVGAHVVSLASGQTATDQNFGNVALGTVSGRKYDDLNGNGVENDGEPGLPGWTIFLDANGNGVLDAGEHFAVTDADGNFVIEDVPQGSYVLTEDLQAGWVRTTPAAPGTFDVNVGFGTANTGYVFGNYREVLISGVKFEDVNGNGVQDPGEPGLAGWTIYIDANNNGKRDVTELAVVTGVDGSYSFPGLRPGSYTIREVPQEGWNHSLPAGGAYQLNTISGDVIADADFGNFRFGQISGVKWNDLDGDGVRDIGEPGLAGWTFFLDANGNGVLDAGERTAVSGAGGVFTFTDVVPGDYELRELRQTGWYQTFPLTGDHPIDETGGHAISLPSGQAIIDQDFGNLRLGSISGTVFGLTDPDGNGPLPETNLGIPDFVVFLDENDNGLLDPGERFTVTGPDGTYTFAELLPGNYVVVQQERPRWLPAPGGGADPQPVVVGLSQQIAGIDFFNRPNGPDLTAFLDSLSLEQMLTVGDTGKGTLRVVNIGTQHVSDIVVLRFYFSADTLVDEDDRLLLEIQDARLNLAPGQSANFKFNFTLPQDLPPGTYFLLVHVDAVDAVAETREDNNVIVGPTPYEFGFFFGEFGDRRNRKLTLVDDDGNVITISLRRGSGQIIGGANIDQIILSDTTDRSTLTITTRGRDVFVDVGNILVLGSLRRINAGAANLTGNVLVTGMLQGADFNDVLGPSIFEVEQWDGRRTLRLSFAMVNDLSIDSAVPLSRFDAVNVADTDDVLDTYQMPWLGALRIDESFDADLMLTGTAAKHSLGNARVGEWVENLTIWAATDLGNLTFGGMRNVSIYAGVNPAFMLADDNPLDPIAVVLPSAQSDFINRQANINRLRLTGVEDSPFEWINSNVAAWSIKRADIGRVMTDNNFQPHGLAAHSVDRYFRERHVGFSPTYKDLVGSQTVSDLFFDQNDDFIAKLV